MGWKEDAQKRVREKQEGTTQKVLEGENSLRVLPDKKDITPDGKLNPKGVTRPPFREFRVHRNLGPKKQDTAACGKDINGQGKCWGCDIQIPALLKSGDASKIAKARDIEAREQFMVNSSRYDPNTSAFGKSKPWWVSTGNGIPGKQRESLATRVYAKISSNRKDVVDPNKGYNLYITRTGTQIQTRYPEVDTDESPMKVPADVLKSIVDLDTLVPKYSEEEIKRCYFGRPREEKKEEELVSRPRRRAPEPVEEEEVEALEEEATEEEYSAEEETEETSEEEVSEEEATEETAEEEVSEEETSEEEVIEEEEPEDALAAEEAEYEEESEPEEEPEPEPEPVRRPAPRPRPVAKPAAKQATAPATKKSGKPAPRKGK